MLLVNGRTYRQAIPAPDVCLRGLGGCASFQSRPPAYPPQVRGKFLMIKRARVHALPGAAAIA